MEDIKGYFREEYTEKYIDLPDTAYDLLKVVFILKNFLIVITNPLFFLTVNA